MATAKRKRTPTKCECCGFSSWNGRVCKGCIKFYGPPAENAIAAHALSLRCDQCHSFEDVMALLGSLCDKIVDISDLKPPSDRQLPKPKGASHETRPVYRNPG